MDNEVRRLRGLGFDREVSREAVEFFVRVGFDPALGARPLKRTVERHLQEAVAGLVLQGTSRRARLT